MHGYAPVRQGMGIAAQVAGRWVVGICWVAAAAGTAQAGEIYKSFDANGNVVYSDHLDPALSKSTVVHLEGAGALPHELHFCWTNCFTLILDDGVYRRTDGTDEHWTVETFSANAVVLHRHGAAADWNGYSQDVVYAGQVAHDRLIGVTVNGKPTSGVDASWGTALNTLPGSNAERDAKDTADPGSPSGDTVSTASAPPPLPAEDQPALAEDGFLWTPGYWYWRARAYVWIPGAWIRPPRAGFLWTPAYWSRAGTVFVFHPGHWGTTVGSYGGVNYGHGYPGVGYTGGHWIGSSFAYNSAVNHVNPAVAHHTYAESVPYQGSRGVAGVAGAARGGATTHTASPRQSFAQAADKPAPTMAVQRTREPPANPHPNVNPVDSGRAPAPTAAPNLPVRSNPVRPTRAAPVKR